jgi:hypothetical protein
MLVILIECDNVRSLGMSCERDIYNIYNILKSYNFDTHILTNNIPYFINKNINKNVLNNNVNNLENILKNNKYAKLYIHISGHGYQCRDKKNIELDGLSEYIQLSSGTFNDYSFNELLKKYVPIDCIIRIAVDTCHSGTFSNFTYQIINNNKIPACKNINSSYFTNAYSISACRDNQLDSCDIGDYGGFGGGLTSHILDNNNLIEFLFGNPIIVCNNLIPILKKLNQEPILLIDKN